MTAGPQVLVFPAWRENPFLNILELNPRTQRYTFLHATTLESLVAQFRRLRAGDVFHIHWTSPVIQQAQSEAEAEARYLRFKREFSKLRSRGVRVIWSVHNRLPHELRYRYLEIDLARLLAQQADAVHVMAPNTSEAVADVTPIDPSTMRMIAHPSYAGIYETGISRASARSSFGLVPDEFSVLFLGQIRPYKGIDVLVQAAARADRSGRDITLLLAGAVKEMTTDAFRDSLPEHLRVIEHLDFVPDNDLARWFRAADIAVFPYRSILNSGSLHLAATFNVPVILPGDHLLRKQFATHPWVAFFDTERPIESIAQLLSDVSLFAGLGPKDFELFLHDITPWQVSRHYRLLLDQLTGRGSGADHVAIDQEFVR